MNDLPEPTRLPAGVIRVATQDGRVWTYDSGRAEWRHTGWMVARDQRYAPPGSSPHNPTA